MIININFEKTLIILTLVITSFGCATRYDPLVLPDYTGPVNIHPCSATVSTLTDNDIHLINVFLGLSLSLLNYLI